jgi:hypothetical protein
MKPKLHTPLQEGNNSPSQKGRQPKVDGVVYQGGGFDTSYRSPQPPSGNRLPIGIDATVFANV